MKKILIKSSGILFVISLIFSCGSGNINPIDSMLGYLPKDELPTMLIDYLNGQKNLKLNETPDSNIVIELFKEGADRTEKVYAILHSVDSLKVSYITIIGHEIYTTGSCCTEYRESNCSLSVYKIENGTATNVNKEAFPKLVNVSESRTNAYLEGKLKSTFIYPSVYTDSIVFTNGNNQLQTKIVWEQDRYMIHDKKDMDYGSFFTYRFYVDDTLLIESLINLNNAIRDTNFEALNHLVSLPVMVDDNNSAYSVSDIEKLYKDFLIEMAGDFDSEIESLKRNEKPMYFSWSSNKVYTNVKCENILTYNPPSFQICQFMYDVTFIKDCESYRLAEINFWPIGMD